MSVALGRIDGMDNLSVTLDDLGDALAPIVATAFADDALRAAGDEELLAVVVAAGRMIQSAQALMVDAVAHIDGRSDHMAHDERLTTRIGCRSLSELVQRATRVSKRTAADVVTAARAVSQRIAISSGEILPADFPAMREALGDGEVGVDGIVAVAGALRGCPGGVAGVLAADTELAASARGTGADGAPPACAEDLRAQAQIWALYLDQDGQEPREARAMRKRGLTFGICRDGLVPVRGNLLAEVAAQFQRECDSVLNPKLDGPASRGPRFTDAGDGGGVEAGGSFAPDGFDPDGIQPHRANIRTRAQKQHDVFATILSVAAASGSLPTLGGAAPTLVVSVRAEDLTQSRGAAHIDGIDEPVPIGVARHIGCAGSITRVILGDEGRIVSLATDERVFNHHQRKAISLRDGGCIIPGCHIPASWCEIHHVVEHARGGPTHTDNGVLICWHHHRTLDTSGWQIRMTNGVPEIRGPAEWDPRQQWRAVTKAPTRRHDIMARRN
jgi:hypothetical protein